MKKCIITGANRGLGLEFARQYSEAGWQVTGTARRPDDAKELNALKVRVLQLDVTDAESVAELAATLDGEPLDMLINNAGIMHILNTLPDVDVNAVAQVLDANILGPIRVTQALLPNLAAGNAKTVVNISSGLSSIDRNTDGKFYGYRESKAALNMFTRTLGHELREQGFIVAAIDPGWVQTDMGGQDATLTPAQSVSAMRSVIDELTVEDTGTFKNSRGEIVPW
ncbi:MAG: SDR family oxidoreductase [Woeseiaceae bacterium]|nr:SDR family oxidoreductase [Woeseiaceae bacterium]